MKNLLLGLNTNFRNLYSSYLIGYVERLFKYDSVSIFMNLTIPLLSTQNRTKISDISKLYMISIFVQTKVLVNILSKEQILNFFNFFKTIITKGSNEFNASSFATQMMTMLMENVLTKWKEVNISNLILYPIFKAIFAHSNRMNSDKIFLLLKFGEKFFDFFKLLNLPFLRGFYEHKFEFLLEKSTVAVLTKEFHQRKYVNVFIVKKTAEVLRLCKDKKKVENFVKTLQRVFQNKTDVNFQVVHVSFLVEIVKVFDFDTFLRCFDFGYVEKLLNFFIYPTGGSKSNEIYLKTMKYFVKNFVYFYAKKSEKNLWEILKFFGGKKKRKNEKEEDWEPRFSRKVLSKHIYCFFFEIEEIIYNVLRLVSTNHIKEDGFDAIHEEIILDFLKFYEKSKKVKKFRILETIFLNLYFVPKNSTELTDSSSDSFFDIDPKYMPILNKIFFSKLNIQKKKIYLNYTKIFSLYEQNIQKYDFRNGTGKEGDEKTPRKMLLNMLQMVSKIESSQAFPEDMKKKLNGVKILIIGLLVHQLQDLGLFDESVIEDLLTFVRIFFDPTLSSTEKEKLSKFGENSIVPIEVYVDCLFFLLSVDPYLKRIIFINFDLFFNQFSIKIPFLISQIMEELLLGLNKDERTELESIVGDEIEEEDEGEDGGEEGDPPKEEDVVFEDDDELDFMKESTKNTLVDSYFDGMNIDEINKIYDTYGASEDVQKEMELLVKEFNVEREFKEMEVIRSTFSVLTELTDKYRGSLIVYNVFVKLCGVYFSIDNNEVNLESKELLSVLLINMTNKLKFNEGKVNEEILDDIFMSIKEINFLKIENFNILKFMFKYFDWIKDKVNLKKRINEIFQLTEGDDEKEDFFGKFERILYLNDLNNNLPPLFLPEIENLILKGLKIYEKFSNKKLKKFLEFSLLILIKNTKIEHQFYQNKNEKNFFNEFFKPLLDMGILLFTNNERKGNVDLKKFVTSLVFVVLNMTQKRKLKIPKEIVESSFRILFFSNATMRSKQMLMFLAKYNMNLYSDNNLQLKMDEIKANNVTKKKKKKKRKRENTTNQNKFEKPKKRRKKKKAKKKRK